MAHAHIAANTHMHKCLQYKVFRLRCRSACLPGCLVAWLGPLESLAQVLPK